jgi:hypothetical protein
LRQAALSAALEEMEHTRITAALARGFGAEVMVPVVETRPVRSLLELAIDNAVEGCVRETFGALVAQHQAMHAEHGGVRAAMEGIARDELRHAEFSWMLDQWLDGVLSASERVAVRAARGEAVARLREELAAPVDAAVVRQAGVPSPEVAQRLVGELSASFAG